MGAEVEIVWDSGSAVGRVDQMARTKAQAIEHFEEAVRQAREELGIESEPTQGTVAATPSPPHGAAEGFNADEFVAKLRDLILQDRPRFAHVAPWDRITEDRRQSWRKTVMESLDKLRMTLPNDNPLAGLDRIAQEVYSASGNITAWEELSAARRVVWRQAAVDKVWKEERRVELAAHEAKAHGEAKQAKIDEAAWSAYRRLYPNTAYSSFTMLSPDTQIKFRSLVTIVNDLMSKESSA